MCVQDAYNLAWKVAYVLKGGYISVLGLFDAV